MDKVSQLIYLSNRLDKNLVGYIDSKDHKLSVIAEILSVLQGIKELKDLRHGNNK